MVVVLDAGILSRLVHRDPSTAKVVAEFLRTNYPEAVIVVPEISDYEVRRSLLKINSTKSISLLDALAEKAIYAAIATSHMRRASQIWAECRQKGHPLAPDEALDGDCVFIAQAESYGPEDIVALTTNRKHLEHYLTCVEA